MEEAPRHRDNAHRQQQMMQQNNFINPAHTQNMYNRFNQNQGQQQFHRPQ